MQADIWASLSRCTTALQYPVLAVLSRLKARKPCCCGSANRLCRFAYQCWCCCAATSAIPCTAPCAGLRRGWWSRQPRVTARDCWLFVNSLQQLWVQGGQAGQSQMVPRKQLLQGRMTAQRQLCRCSRQVPACRFLRLPLQTQVSQSHVTRQLRLHIVAAAVQRAQNQGWFHVLIQKTLQQKHSKPHSTSRNTRMSRQRLRRHRRWRRCARAVHNRSLPPICG